MDNLIKAVEAILDLDPVMFSDEDLMNHICALDDREDFKGEIVTICNSFENNTMDAGASLDRVYDWVKENK